MSKTAKAKPTRFGTYQPTRLGAQPAPLPLATAEASAEPEPTIETEPKTSTQAYKRRIVPFSSRITPEAEEALKELGKGGRKTVDLLGEALNLLFRAHKLPPVA